MVEFQSGQSVFVWDSEDIYQATILRKYETVEGSYYVQIERRFVPTPLVSRFNIFATVDAAIEKLEDTADFLKRRAEELSKQKQEAAP